jgi:hypothetical protein
MIVRATRQKFDADEKLLVALAGSREAKTNGNSGNNAKNLDDRADTEHYAQHHCQGREFTRGP